MAYSIYSNQIDTFPAGYQVRNQGRGNRCPAFTLGNWWDILRARYAAANPGAAIPDAACMDAIYYYGRLTQGQSGDIGAHFWHLQRSLAVYGLPTGAWSDFGDLSFANSPPPQIVASGLANRPVEFSIARYIASGPHINSVPETVAMYLSAGNPLPCIVMLSSVFWEIYGSSSLLDARYTYDPSDKRGEHAVLLTGVDRTNGVYEFLNSYGPDFGYQGRFTMSFASFGAAITQLWAVQQSLIPTVPEFNVMNNPIPTALTAPQFAKWEARVIAELRAAKLRDGWPGALGTAQLYLKLSDKQFEKYAPALDGGPGHGLPRGIVQHLVNTGEISMPASFFETEA